MATEVHTVENLNEFATNIRESNKKFTLVYAYNGTGKTRLSSEFKEIGKLLEGKERDTLYFNAFTEDLFWWNNDLDDDNDRFLNINTASHFFDDIEGSSIDDRIRPLLREYFDFNFRIIIEESKVVFSKEIVEEGSSITLNNIKISRGEERIFIWCFFLAIAQIAIEKQEPYDWVDYLYIDDPISSLDDINAIAVAHHLGRILKSENNQIKTVISTHHSLFFNVLCNELGTGARKLLLRQNTDGYNYKWTSDTPFIYHISIIQQLDMAIKEDLLYTYHFNVLRNILEKAANFHGFASWKDCIIVNDDDDEGTLRSRMINVMNHGGYSLFEPTEMVEQNKIVFSEIFENFKRNYKFNKELFNEPEATAL
ncbi:anticodon nuclease [Flavobacterium wongokense]|uniref:anticodon nuclease n=1 Tax=Flavobacterium wongokense TaxID=2910674 RepID=UPI001F2B6154|nr:anticodon nuclease [Flavobacterium sp. WG47]MCF6130892.1 anticodon nuclease [Flavobacterium sp. WG47]